MLRAIAIKEFRDSAWIAGLGLAASACVVYTLIRASSGPTIPFQTDGFFPSMGFVFWPLALAPGLAAIGLGTASRHLSLFAPPTASHLGDLRGQGCRRPRAVGADDASADRLVRRLGELARAAPQPLRVVDDRIGLVRVDGFARGLSGRFSDGPARGQLVRHAIVTAVRWNLLVCESWFFHLAGRAYRRLGTFGRPGRFGPLRWRDERFRLTQACDMSSRRNRFEKDETE